MAIVTVPKAVRRTVASSANHNQIIDNQVDIDSRVITNAAAINTNEAAILSLAATGVPGLTANFNIVEWDYLDSTTGIVPGQEYYRFNKPPGPTGELGDFTDTTIELTPPRDIDEIRWLNAGTLQFYGSSGTDSTWGTSLKANTTLSFYIYSKGSRSPKLTEYELASGTTFTWGAGGMGSGIQFSASLPDGMSETTEIRFLVAEKGQSANVNTYLGLHLPDYKSEPDATVIGNASIFINSMANSVLYDTGRAIPFDTSDPVESDTLYQIYFESGPMATSTDPRPARLQIGSLLTSMIVMKRIKPLPSGVVSGTTEFDSTLHSALPVAMAYNQACHIHRAPTGNNVWISSLWLDNQPSRMRAVITKLGDIIEKA